MDSGLQYSRRADVAFDRQLTTVAARGTVPDRAWRGWLRLSAARRICMTAAFRAVLQHR